MGLFDFLKTNSKPKWDWEKAGSWLIGAKRPPPNTTRTPSSTKKNLILPRLKVLHPRTQGAEGSLRARKPYPHMEY